VDAWLGRPPPADGAVTVLPAAGRVEAAVAFTAHAVVATAVPAGRVLERGPDGFGGVHAPEFLVWLARGGRIGVLDLVLAAPGRGGDRDSVPERRDLDDHPRVRHARGLRDEVRVWADERGLITLGVGLAGRCEMSAEATVPGAGHGRELITAALRLVPEGEPVFAAVSPGNVRSVRAFLAQGFQPVASEVQVLVSRTSRPGTRSPRRRCSPRPAAG
jgi:hypothetical protein